MDATAIETNHLTIMVINAKIVHETTRKASAKPYQLNAIDANKKDILSDVVQVKLERIKLKTNHTMVQFI